jgi:hypothetical protein
MKNMCGKRGKLEAQSRWTYVQTITDQESNKENEKKEIINGNILKIKNYSN